MLISIIFGCNFNSLCGYNGAAVFETLASSDIAYVECYVKTTLAVALENSDYNEKSHFFGSFASNPKEFTFSRGERSLIDKIINHVKKIAKSEGLSRFKEIESEKKEIDPEFAKNASRILCQTSIGMAFCKLPSLLSLQSTSNLEKNKIVSDSRSNMTENLKSIEYGASTLEPEYIDIADLNVQSTPYNDSKSDQNTNDIEERVGDVGIQSNISSSPPDANEEKELDKSMEYNRDLLYTQLYTQIACKQRLALINDEHTKDFIVDVKKGKTSTSLVKVAEMNRDGNCLFAAISHQLYGMKTNSSEHNQMTDELRKAVVQHILADVDSFYHDLKDRVLECSNQLFGESSLRDKCIEFVTQRLSQTGIWGGIETIRAVAKIKCVNVLIVNDDATCVLGNAFNDSYQKSIMISYRSIGPRGTKRNHYDSVVYMTEAMLEKFAQDVIIFIKKQIQLQKDILNCQNFEYV